MNEMQQKEKTVIALGMFDGVHAGHRALLRRAVELAQAHRAKSLVYTFSNHPRSVFAQAPKLLMTAGERRVCMLRLGVDQVRMDVFDRALADLSPEAYILRLMEDSEISGMVAGYNYSFGKGGEGSAETLHALGDAHGFQVEIIPPVQVAGKPVSSTLIRELLEAGEIEAADEMLVDAYAVSGSVVGNRHIGSEIGFPTANLRPPEEKALPLAGVYATRVLLADERFPAVTNVGSNPTVEGKFVSVESHLLDFSGDLYGREICVEFLKFLRVERRFDNKAALAKQISADTQQAKAFLAGAGLQ